jgi:diguanylate cyclase (GGDEF)-like protein/PAS domain S-box-containing protein
MRYDLNELLQSLPDAAYIVGPDRRITAWNRAAEQLTGFSAREVVGSSCADYILIHVDAQGNILCKGNCPLSAAMADGKARVQEIYLHHKRGHRMPVSVRVSPLKDEAGRIVGALEIFSDLSARTAVELRLKELETLAMLDHLTQLANRRYADAELQSRLDEKRRYGLSFGVILMDIDQFKRFNDEHGHDAGDRALQAVARTLQSTARQFDLFGRWGGEEIIGIFRSVDGEELRAIAERSRALIARTLVDTADGPRSVTISLGATLARDDDTAESLMQRVDRLLYGSKEAGRDRLTTDLALRSDVGV